MTTKFLFAKIVNISNLKSLWIFWNFFLIFYTAIWKNYPLYYFFRFFTRCHCNDQTDLYKTIKPFYNHSLARFSYCFSIVQIIWYFLSLIKWALLRNWVAILHKTMKSEFQYNRYIFSRKLQQYKTCCSVQWKYM